MAHSLSQKRPLARLEATAAVESPLQTGLAWWLLLVHLALTPLIFCLQTCDAFEENKVAFLKLTAWMLTALGLSAWLQRGRLCDSARTFTHLIGRNLISYGVVAFLLSAVVSTWFSISPLTSWRGAWDSYGGLQTLLGYGVLFLATRTLCRTVADGRRLLAAVVFVTAVLCCHAVLQLAGNDPILWDGVSIFAGYSRPFATLAHANSLGAYLVMALPLIAAFAHDATRERRWLSMLLLSCLGIAAAGVVFLTLSRAAWVGLIVALVVVLLGWWFSTARRSAVLLSGFLSLSVCVAICGAAWGWFGYGLHERLAHLDEGGGRREIWRSGWEIYREHPVCGAGLDTFRLAFGAHRTTAYFSFEGDSTPSKAHNEFLHILATQGNLGGVAVLVLIVGLVWCGLRSWRRSAVEDRPFVIAVFAGIVGFLTTNSLGFTVVGTGGLFVCCAALLSRWHESDFVPDANLGKRCGLASWPIAAGLAVCLMYGVNMGLTQWPMCLLLSSCGAVFALLLVRKQKAGPLMASGLANSTENGLERWMPQLGVGAVTLVALVFNVWCPWQASRACVMGDAQLAEDPDAARACYVRAIVWDSDRDLYFDRLSTAVQQRDFRQAAAALEQANVLVPGDPYHHANLARLLTAAAQHDSEKRPQAASAWDRALQQDPKNICFIAEAARSALTLGDTARARQLIQGGLQLYPRYALFRSQLGALSLTQGHVAEAAQQFETALHADWHGNVEDEGRAYAALATCHLRQGHYQYARDLAQYASTLQPRWPTALLLLAEALEGLGEQVNAYRTYQHVLTLTPLHPGALSGLQRLQKRVNPATAKPITAE